MVPSHIPKSQHTEFFTYSPPQKRVCTCELKGLALVAIDPKLRCSGGRCGCRMEGYAWINPIRQTIWFETPKAASTSMKAGLQLNSPVSDALKVCARLQDASLKFNMPSQLLFRWIKDMGLERFSNWLHSRLGHAFWDPRYTSIHDKFKALYDSLRFDFHIRKGQLNFIRPQLKDTFYPFPGGSTEAFLAYPQYQTVAIVRSPLSRLASSYRMYAVAEELAKNYRYHESQTTFGRDITGIDFEDFVPLAMKHRNHHWETLDRVLPVIDGKLMVQELISFARIKQEKSRIVKLLGLNDDLPWLNSTTIRPLPSLSSQARKLIEKEYHLELEFCGEYY